ncbi:MAG: TIGR04282 family arsenosugar biosynthesis glycosyltransferase [Oleiphilaceae bacterium]|nr:TIGR04282 family arsenosugar biosynthesis glycosyltransferase [Oleiphilaceae bacterium]
MSERLNPDAHRDVMLIQFAKWPEVGEVKTRLIPALGAAGAMKAHMQLTTTVLTHLAATELSMQFWWDRAVSQVPEPATHLVAALGQRAIVQKTQTGGDLGARMLDAITGNLRRYGKVIIVGSDCPSVEPAYVFAASEALDHSDVVIGPSNDGGYVLLGARRVTAGMLAGIAWGSAQVMAQTCDRLEAEGLSVSLLEPRWDVDDIEDWERFMTQASSSESDA